MTETLTTRIPYTSSQACTIDASDAVPSSTSGFPTSKPEATIMAGTDANDASLGNTNANSPTDEPVVTPPVVFDDSSAQKPMVADG